MQKMNRQDWLSALSQMTQFILGFLLGVTLLAGSAVGAAYYYFKKVSANIPEKPVYTAETTSTEVNNNSSQIEVESAFSAETNSDFSVVEVEPASSVETNSNNRVVESEIPPNAYYANVTWPQGLSLRAKPSIDATRIGGIGYDARILILSESDNKQWQKVRIPESDREGWVKAGNVKRASN